MPEFLACWQVSRGDPLERAYERVRAILLGEGIGAFSVFSGGRPLIWTAYFAIEMPDRISILTSPRSEHGAALAPGSPISMCAFRRPRFWGEPICGLQAFGVVQEIGGIAAESAYCTRFPEYADWRSAGGITESRFYSIRLESIKLIDEEHFGEEIHVVLRAQ